MISINSYYSDRFSEEGFIYEENDKKIMSAILGFCLLLSVVWACPARTELSGGDGWVGAWSTSPVKFNLKKMMDMEWIKCDGLI